MNKINKTVVVGLSGGVDSSVTAFLLKEQGYNVIALFMRNWHNEEATLEDECPWIQDSNDALLVAQKLGIPFQVVDLSKEYHDRIINYMFNQYERGFTPNPDVLCNREIKFDVFLKIAENFGADFVATGHYCRKDSFMNSDGKTVYRLLSGKDNNKDQSYFLCQLSQKQLSKVLFPIGELQKSQVREIAKKQNLITAEKKDSQGLCFVGKIKLPDFLKQKLKPKTGKVIYLESNHNAFDVYQSNPLEKDFESMTKPYSFGIEDGEIIGTHSGAYYFTVGQRKGLGIGGFEEPLFVIDTDVENNLIFVGEGKSHPGINRKILFIKDSDFHWLREDLKIETGDKITIKSRIRYRQELSEAILYKKEKGYFVVFQNYQFAITPGQFCAIYKDDELIASGVIEF